VRIRRSKPTDNYVLVPNGTARDERLSYLARGVLVDILSRPDGWETNADTLSERARQHRGAKRGEGRRALREAFAELEAAGYMIRRKERGANGRIVTLMEAYDTPQNRGTASGMSAPTCDNAQTTSSDRGTANGTSESHRDTANGTPAATSTNGQTPSSHRGTANRRPVSGTSNRRRSKKNPSSTPATDSAQKVGNADAGEEERIPDAFAYIQPLIRAMTDAGFNAISWQMQADDIQSVARVLKRTDVDAMVKFALGAKATARTPIGYATFFLRGWLGLPPQSAKPRAAASPPEAPPVPEWCGKCDAPEYRWLEGDDGRQYRCPTCNPDAIGARA
jgi:hypothetical protein